MTKGNLPPPPQTVGIRQLGLIVLFEQVRGSSESDPQHWRQEEIIRSRNQCSVKFVSLHINAGLINIIFPPIVEDKNQRSPDCGERDGPIHSISGCDFMRRYRFFCKLAKNRKNWPQYRYLFKQTTKRPFFCWLSLSLDPHPNSKKCQRIRI